MKLKNIWNQKNMNINELNIVDKELSSFFSSNYVETKIKDVLKLSFSEFNQRLLLGVQTQL